MKIIKLVLVTVVVFCCNGIVFSQTISGVVRDSLNDKPIGQVNFNLIKSKTVFSSNDQGLFHYKLNKENELMTVSYLGYQTMSIDLSKYNENKDYKVNIALLPLPFELDSVTVYDKKLSYSVIALPVKEASTFNRNLLKHSKCVLINNNLGKEGFLKDISVNFETKHNSYKQTALIHFIFNFYEYNVLTNTPGDLIEVVNVVGETKGNFFRRYFNLEKYRIPFAKNGVCVSLIVVERDEIDNLTASNDLNNVYKSVSDLFTFSESVSNSQTPLWIKGNKYPYEWTNDKLKYMTNNIIGCDVSFKIKVKSQR